MYSMHILLSGTTLGLTPEHNVHTEWLNFLAGGDVEQRLQRAPEIEITFPYNEDRMIIQQQVLKCKGYKPAGTPD